MAEEVRDAGPRAVVVAVGDELLYGETTDTNGSWMARELSGLGFRVARRWVVGDLEEEIASTLEAALAVGEVVLVTGGLGPTPDDRTREAVSRLLGRPLEVDPAILGGLRARFRDQGFPDLPEISHAMARVPRGGTPLRNPRGAAPGLLLEVGEGRVVILLPGVPAEMRGIFQEEVAPLLLERFQSRFLPAVHRVIHTTGIPESLLATEVERLLPREGLPVSLAYLPELKGVRIRMTLRGIPESEEVEEAFRRVEEALAPVLTGYRYVAESGDLAEAVGAALENAGATLAVAESCTGGLIAQRITARPGSSKYFLGGVVAYGNRAKEELLGVDPGIIEAGGAVCREVAEALALGAARRFGARAGIGVTGVAGPGGGTEEKPVGTVWYAASLDGAVVSRLERFPGGRSDVRERAAQAALHLLLRHLEGRGP